MPSIRFERVSFAHSDATPLLDDVDLLLPDGWTALVGENGAGKSTLLALAAGRLAPWRGRVRLDPPGGRVVLCPQGVAEMDEAVRALAARDDRQARRLRDALALDPAGLARWPTLSPGERKRWQIGSALAAEPDVLLLDEPTNHADAEARALLAGALRAFGGAGVLVSHDRGLLEAVAVRTARLHRGSVRVHAGGYGAARAAWEAEARAAWDRRAAAQEEARQAASRLASAQRTRAAADAARRGGNRDRRDRDARSIGAKTVRAWAEARLGRDVGRLRAAAERAREAIPEAPPASPGGAVLLGYQRAPRPVLLALDAPVIRAGPVEVLRDVRLVLRREERVRVEGANGAGKSTLLGALLAASTLPPEQVLHLPQELPDGAAAALLDEVRGLPPAVRGRVFSAVAALGADPGRLLASKVPSPGQARALRIALGLGRHAWLLVLDEPTNHLDLPTVERLEAALAAWPGALLLVTHDDALAARCTSGRWRVEAGRVEAG